MSTATYPSSRHDRPHARLYGHHLNHAAWRSLSPAAFKLLSYLMAEYRPEKPNSFPVGTRRVSLMIEVSEPAATKAVDELIKTGHVRLQRPGTNIGRVATRERVVSLTRYDTETAKGEPDLPKKLWQKRFSNVAETGV
jgi:hypothetical protein